MYRDKDQRDFARTLRNTPTTAEKHLWHFLRTEKLRNQKFRRQAAIGPYIVDFVCFALKLIIELDGPQHQEPTALDYDTRRTAWLSSRGFKVIRFRNQELDEDIRTVIETIERAIECLEVAHKNPPLPNPPRRGEGAGTASVRCRTLSEDVPATRSSSSQPNFPDCPLSLDGRGLG
jgi:very-short-patch-repair endonuclease